MSDNNAYNCRSLIIHTLISTLKHTKFTISRFYFFWIFLNGRKIRGRYAAYAPFGFRRYQEDIRFADTHAVQDFAQGIKLSDVFHVGVHTFNSRSLLTGIPVEWRPSYEFLVLDIGSNDIAQLQTVNKRAMELLDKCIYDWASLAPARCVIFLGVLPRTAGLRGSACQFEQNRLYYNAALTSLCKNSNHMTFAKVRGFEGRDPIGYGCYI